MSDYSMISKISNIDESYALKLLGQVSQKESNSNYNFNELYKSAISSSGIKTSTGQSLQDIPIVIEGQSSVECLNFNSFYNSGNVSAINTTSNDEVKNKIYESVNKYCNEYNIDSRLVLSLIMEESACKPNVTSSAGAMGLMQLMPSVCQQFGVKNPYNIDENIKGGVQLLKYHLDNYNGDMGMALMAYAAGSGTVQSRGVTSINDLYKMPEETQNFIAKLNKIYYSGEEI